MPPVSVLMKPSSGNCNMICDYCFYCDEMKNRERESYGFMSEATLKNVIRRTMLVADNHISYAFQGGEPLLRGLPFFEKVMQYQTQYNKRGIPVSNALQTNGYALNEEWCKFFKKNNFLIGVSVDGTRSIHDFYRHSKTGTDTYDIIKNNIALLERYEVDYNILTVVTSTVAVNIKEIYREYEKQGWKFQQYIECLDPIGEERGQRHYSLTPKVYGQFLVDLFNMWYEDWKEQKQPYIRKFENYIAILAGYLAEACDQRGVCSIQTVVEADGSVYPCDFYMTDEYCLGNFNTHRLSEINEKRQEIGFIERSLRISDKCKKCRFYSVCRGGCQRNKIQTDSEDGYYNYFCEGYHMFFEQCIDKMMEIAKSL